MANRRDYPPLLEPQAVYETLKALHLGDAIPPQIYVSDYRDGVIPDWRIHYSVFRGVNVLLVAFDMSNTYHPGGQPAQQMGLFDNDLCYPAVRIISSPRKTLRSCVVEFSGLDAWPSMLCDMLQQAKIAVKSEARR